MKVILTTDIKGQGKAGQVVKVSDGYARNYLFPKGMAKEATAANLNTIKIKKAAEDHKAELEKNEAEELAERINALSLEITAKSGEKGRLFGSITGGHIAGELLAQHKIDVDKKKIVLKEHIKETGSYSVPVKLHTDVAATLNIIVKS